MLIVVIAVAVVAVAVPLSGGTWSRATSVVLRSTWLVALALAVQVAIISVIDVGSVAVGRALHTLTYGLVGWFLVANRRVRWLWLVGAGWFANTVVIVANGGVMPTSIDAAETLARVGGSGFENSTPLAAPRLAILGDILATPADMPLANVFSIGDVVLVVGLVAVVVSAARGTGRCGAAIEPGRELVGAAPPR